MRWRGLGLVIVAMSATGAHAQAPGALSPLSAAVFEGGKAVPTEWKTAETASGRSSLQVSLGGVNRTASGAVALSAADQAAFQAESFDVRMTRQWDSLNFRAGERNIEVTPHTGVGFTEAGAGAEAGATVSLEDKVVSRLGDLGVRDGKSFGDRGRWYLFAATSGRSVGLNLLRGGDGELRRAGWSTDGTSALVSDAQVGVGWRKGPMQASVGYLHREIKPKQHGIRGMETTDDNLVAVSFSFKPR